MTNKQILEKVFQKAYEGGHGFARARAWYFEKEVRWFSFILSPSFAKAFWGEEMIDTDILEDVWMSEDGDVAEYKQMKAWQYHQHRMLDEIQAGRNPLAYLEKFL